MTGKNRNDLATVGLVADLTDVKIGAVINAYVLPLRERVAELERPIWSRIWRKLRRTK